jgi:hypothetical protein
LSKKVRRRFFSIFASTSPAAGGIGGEQQHKHRRSWDHLQNTLLIAAPGVDAPPLDMAYYRG